MTQSQPPRRNPDTTRRIRLADRLLAEAVRAVERDGAALLDEPNTDSAARAAGGDFERRIVNRARGLSIASSMRDALRQVRTGSAWIVLAGVVLAALAGAGTVRAALGSAGAEPVNFFWVLTSVLGVQSLLITVWLLIVIVRPRAANVSPLGGAALAIGRWTVARLDAGPKMLAALSASASVSSRGAIGRWTLSAISHALWLSFNAGCVVMLVLLLSAKEYTFTWETTILSRPAYERITQVIAVLPESVGFIAPNPQQVAVSETGASAAELKQARAAWSSLLVGSVVMYAAVPRFVLLLLCLLARRSAAGRYRLDTTAPGYLRLRPRLLPAAEKQAAVDGDAATSAPSGASPGPSSDSSPGAAPRARGDRGRTGGNGPAAIIGLEIDRPDGAWPPPVHSVRWVDLGFVDGRDDRRRVVEELATLTPAPRLVFVVCALTTTPDRGLGAFIRQLADADYGPVAVVLSTGHVLRNRVGAAQVEQRVADWRSLAAAAGVPDDRVLEIDLDHLTDTTQRALARLAGGETSDLAGGSAEAGEATADARIAAPPAGQIDAAFALITTAVREWPAAPDRTSAAELHKSIAALYRHAATSWRDVLAAPAALARDATGELRKSAANVVSLLPDRLKRSPKWLAAGAATGALGCVAAAALISPVAIGALPMWSAIGAAIAAAVQMRGDKPAGTDDEQSAAAGEWRSAARSATLFSLLLELQGRDEAMISRVLDATLDPALDAKLDSPPDAKLDSRYDAKLDSPLDAPPDDASSRGAAGSERARVCAEWLGEIRHRFDLALARETKS